MGKNSQGGNRNKGSSRAANPKPKKAKAAVNWDDVDPGALEDFDDPSDDEDPIELVQDFSEGESVAELKKKLFGSRDSSARADMINSQNKQGQTLLHVALEDAKPSLTQMLLQSGANVNLRDRGGKTPLHVALGMPGMEDAISLLAASPDLDPNSYDKSGKSLLLTALQYGALDAAQMLLSKGSSVTRLDKHKHTALHMLFKRQAAEEQVERLVTSLQEAGCDVNAQSADGETPLMLAAQVSSLTTIEKLLSLGADAAMVTPRGKSSADYAEEADRNDVAEMLVRRGAPSGQEAATNPPVKEETEEEVMARIERAQAAAKKANAGKYKRKTLVQMKELEEQGPEPTPITSLTGRRPRQPSSPQNPADFDY